MLEIKKIFEQFLMRYEQAPYNKDNVTHFYIVSTQKKIIWYSSSLKMWDKLKSMNPTQCEK